MKLIKFFITTLALIFATSSVFPQETNQLPEKKYTVLIMPFLEFEPYPFTMDQYRESILTAFYARGFELIMDDETWSKILDFDYNFINLSTDQADSIAIVSGADLIVYGDLAQHTNTRTAGSFAPSATTEISLLLKVYDTEKSSFAVYERAKFYERWGLNVRINTIYDLAEKAAIKLNSMGYK